MSNNEVTLKRKCPVCGNGTGLFLHRQRFILPDKHPLREGYDVVLCSHCYFLFADSAVSQKDYDVYYSDFSKYEDNHTSTGGGEDGFDAVRSKSVAADIAKVLGNPSARVMDIGCANGGILKKLKDNGYKNVVGVDPSLACVNSIKANGIEAYKASLFDMPADLPKSDLIILSHVMEHILDLKPCIGQVSRFLKPRGILYIEVPDAERYSEYITSPYQEFNTEHINHFTQTSLDNLFTSAGFKKESGGAKVIESAPNVPYPAIYGFYRVSGTNRAPVKDEGIVMPTARYIKNSQTVIDRIDNFLKSNFGSEPVLVWGTGQLSMKLLSMTALAKMNVKNFVDSNPILKGKVINGIRIVHPTELQESGNTKILITSTIHEAEIQNDIKNKYKLTNPAVGLSGCLDMTL